MRDALHVHNSDAKATCPRSPCYMAVMRIEMGQVEASADVDEKALRTALSAKAKQIPANLRAGGPGGPASAVGEAPQGDTLVIVDEIIASAKQPVAMTPFAESRSLIELVKATAGAELPPEFKVDHEQQAYDFYWVEFGFSIMLDEDQFPRSAELGVVIDEEGPEGPRRTRPVRVFPDRKDAELFSVDVVGGVGLDAGFSFSVPGEANTVLPLVDVEADANVKAKLRFGPYSFSFRRAAVKVVGTGADRVYWEYTPKSELRGTNEFKSILLLKVAQETTRVTLKTAVKVVPCRRKWVFFSDELPAKGCAQDIEVELVRS